MLLSPSEAKFTMPPELTKVTQENAANSLQHLFNLATCVSPEKRALTSPKSALVPCDLSPEMI